MSFYDLRAFIFGCDYGGAADDRCREHLRLDATDSVFTMTQARKVARLNGWTLGAKKSRYSDPQAFCRKHKPVKS